MGIYTGTGFFISEATLNHLKFEDISAVYPDYKKNDPTNFITYLAAHNLCCQEKIVQYGEAVRFVGLFEKVFDESDITEDSGDYEKVISLLESDGYDYSVSNLEEPNATLTTLITALKQSGALSDYDVLESYWFIAPFPPENFSMNNTIDS